MTWAHLARGQLPAAVQANLGGTLLGILTPVAALWMLASAAAGRWLVWVPNDLAIAWIAVALVLITLAAWALRLTAE